MVSDNRDAFATPRTDAAERFFHDPGRQPFGFVASGLSRVLEVELARAMAELKSHGLDAPPPLDAHAQAALQAARKPTPSIFRASASAAAQTPSTAQAGASPTRALPAAFATASLGEAKSYDDGAVLYRRAERGEHVYILLEGEVAVSQCVHGGADYTATRGDVFGMHAIFDESVHTETLHASGPVQCVRLPTEGLRALLSADTSVLPPLLMALVLQARMVRDIARLLGAGAAPAVYEVLGQKTLTGPELHRALVDARAQGEGRSEGRGDGLHAAQLMCLKLQTTDHMPTQLLRAGLSLGQPGAEHGGMGLMLVHGKAQVRIAEERVQLGQGAVIGVAEGLTGQPFPWDFSAAEDINARALPVDKALQRLDRADPALRALASHLCAFILARQRAVTT